MAKKSSSKAVLILGSSTDEAFAKKITDKLKEYEISFAQHIASAHREPKKVLKIINLYKNESAIVYITIAGRSNALSGFVASNSHFPTVACPPFQDKMDMMVNIHSSLQMPSNVPVLTVLDPANCALAVKRIFDIATEHTED